MSILFFTPNFAALPPNICGLHEFVSKSNIFSNSAILCGNERDCVQTKIKYNNYCRYLFFLDGDASTKFWFSFSIKFQN